MKKISPLQWAKYKRIVNEFHDDANQTPIIWKRKIASVPKFGENINSPRDEVELLGLIQYNNYRTWPMTLFSQTGSEDKQSEVLILNIDYLKRNDLLDKNGNFAYNPAEDEFIHNGIKYEAAGDTQTSQTNNEALFFMIVLKRKNNATTQAP